MLNELKIFGYRKIEPAIITALVSGDPLLFIGTHGTAKTILCQKLAKLLQLKYHAYDASKAMFEDVIGFPDPLSINNGMMKYVSTPMSIWEKEFILIDELSRAQPSLQNKWLEIIRSRKIMGVELPNLKYVFAAMNPINYAGSNMLDDALIGRFSVIIEMPKINDMIDEDIKSIMINMNEDDSRELKRERKDTNIIELRRTINKKINIIRENFNNPLYSSIATPYILNTLKTLNEDNIEIDGRRMGMLYRNFKIRLAMEDVKKNTDKKKILLLYSNVLEYTLPFRVNKDILPDANYRIIAEKASNNDNNKIYFNPLNPKQSMNHLSKNKHINEEDKEKFIRRFIEELDKAITKNDTNKIADYIYTYIYLFSLIKKNKITMKISLIELIMGMFKKRVLNNSLEHNEYQVENKIDTKSVEDVLAMQIVNTGQNNENIKESYKKLTASLKKHTRMEE